MTGQGRLGSAADRPLMHDLSRALGGLTIGVVKEHEAGQGRRQEMALAERQLQFQVEIAGEGGTGVATDTFDVDFDAPFVFAPGLRDSDQDIPQFSKGISLQSGAGVMIDAHVVAWKRDPDTDYVTGATIQTSAVSPATDEAVPFSGHAHLTFQGYCALEEDESEMA